MTVPTVGTGFAYALQALKGDACLPTAEHCREAVNRMISFIDIYSTMPDDMVGDVTDEVYERFFQSNSGAFPMTSCLRYVLENRKPALSKKGESLVTVVQLRIAKIMCDNLETASGIGHIAGAHIERAYWLAQSIYAKDRIVSRRLMRLSGKCLSGEFVDAFFWRLQEEAKEKYGSIIEDLLRFLTEGMLQKNQPVELLSQYLRRSGRGKRASDAAVAAFEERRQARHTTRAIPNAETAN